MFDTYLAVLLIDFIAHRGEDCLKLGEGREGVLLGDIHSLVGLLPSVVSEYAVNGFLGTSPLVVVDYLPAIGLNP